MLPARVRVQWEPGSLSPATLFIGRRGDRRRSMQRGWGVCSGVEHIATIKQQPNREDRADQ